VSSRLVSAALLAAGLAGCGATPLEVRNEKEQPLPPGQGMFGGGLTWEWKRKDTPSPQTTTAPDAAPAAAPAAAAAAPAAATAAAPAAAASATEQEEFKKWRESAGSTERQEFDDWRAWQEWKRKNPK
jgi:hypothetical protein